MMSNYKNLLFQRPDICEAHVDGNTLVVGVWYFTRSVPGSVSHPIYTGQS